MISLGFIFGIIFTIIFLLLGKLSVYYGKKIDRADYLDGDYRPILIWGGRIWMTIVLILAAIGFYPYNMQYHSYRPVSGTVTNISNRLVSAGDNGGSNQKFVVTFQGSNQAYGCEDTRCALIKKGDHLALKCIRSYQYASVSGYDCRYDQ